MYLIPAAIVLAIAALGVFIYAFAVSRKESRASLPKEIEPVVPLRAAGPAQLELEQLKRQVPDLQAHLASSQLQIDKLVSDKEGLRKEIEALTQEIARNEAKAGSPSSVSNQRVPELERQLSDRETLIAQLKEELVSVKGGFENTKIKAQALQSELGNVQEKNEALIKENGVCQTQVVAWKEEIEKLKTEIDRLNNELKEQDKQHAPVAEPPVPAQGDSEDLTARIEGYNKEIAKLNDIIAGLRKKEDLAGLISKEEYDQVKQQINEKESLLSRLKGELEGIKPQYQALQADLEQEKKNEAETVRKLQEATRELDGLRAQLQNRFPAEIAYLKKRLGLGDESSDKDVLVNTIEALENSLQKSQELEKQLQARSEFLQQQDSGRTVAEEEYIKVKQKLEAAEKILRLIHGAG